ncbi:hypothetical protein BGZ94_009875 [Podila epigama]|nr:hypothetical protein BGZ94_009875 [Podila epigama]
MGAINSKDSPEDTAHPFHSPRLEGRPLLGRFHPHLHHDYSGSHTPRPFPTAPVTELVKEARYAIINALDTSLTRDELGSPEIYLALLLPIVRKYREERKETAAVYCFLLNRWKFLKDAENDLANARLNETRAHACEIVATKVLKAFSMRQLIDVLTYDFSPVRRKSCKDARSRIYLPHFESEPATEPMNAIEIAITGRAKHFLSNPLVQEIVNQIWLGNIVFFATAIDYPETCLNASQQEIRTVTVYDSRNIQFLRLSRLRVPRYKTTFQMVSFSAFIIVYTIVTFAKQAELTAPEVIMDVFALSYTLDEFLQLKESGPTFYFETVWNLFDVPIYIIFLVFMGIRTMGLHDNTKSYGDIAWLLLQVFFGSAFLGFEEASELSELFGAPLMVSANAKEEFMFLFTVKVMEEVKSDALYEFQPPFNIMAGMIVWPCSFVYDSIVVGKVSRNLSVMVLQKQPQYMPVRPAPPMDHSSQYGTIATAASEPVMGGVAKRRYDNAAAAAAMAVSAAALSASESNCSDSMHTSQPETGGGGSVGDFAVDVSNSTSARSEEGDDMRQDIEEEEHRREQLHRLRTDGLQNDLRRQEILSPYFENIRRFRDATMKSHETGDNGQGATNVADTSVYSYYTPAPIGMGTALGVERPRRGSILGYGGQGGRWRHATDATLARTFQGVWPSYDGNQDSMVMNDANRMYIGEDDGLGGLDGSSSEARYWGNTAEGSPMYRAKRSRLENENDIEEVRQMVEVGFAEMRTRMMELDDKLDQVMRAVIALSHDALALGALLVSVPGYEAVPTMDEGAAAASKHHEHEHDWGRHYHHHPDDYDVNALLHYDAHYKRALADTGDARSLWRWGGGGGGGWGGGGWGGGGWGGGWGGGRWGGGGGRWGGGGGRWGGGGGRWGRW